MPLTPHVLGYISFTLLIRGVPQINHTTTTTQYILVNYDRGGGNRKTEGDKLSGEKYIHSSVMCHMARSHTLLFTFGRSVGRSVH